MATLELIKSIPLFAGLESRELEDFLRIFVEELQRALCTQDCRTS